MSPALEGEFFTGKPLGKRIPYLHISKLYYGSIHLSVPSFINSLFFFKVNCRHQYTCSSVLQPAFKLGLVFVDVNFVFNACLKHSFVKF